MKSESSFEPEPDSEPTPAVEDALMARLQWLVEHLGPDERSEFFQAIELASHRIRFNPTDEHAQEWLALVRTWLVSTRLRFEPHWQRSMAATRDPDGLRQGRPWSLEQVDEALHI
jgi:hypothetical protein